MPPSKLQVLAESCTTWFWRPLELLGPHLHIRHGVSHIAINLMYAIFWGVLGALNVLSPLDDAPVTLTMAMKQLQLHDQFSIRPMCPACLHTYLANTPAGSSCMKCKIGLFTNSGTSRSSMPPKPKLQSPFILPSQLLITVINSTPAAEVELGKWQTWKQHLGRLDCIQDGRIW